MPDPAPTSGAPSESDQPILEMKGVSKSFHTGRRSVTALDQVNVRITAGTITGLVGPDGSGKTTFMRLAAGLIRPDAGRIRVPASEGGRRPEAGHKWIGYMPQRFGLYEDLTVQENLDLFADLNVVTGEERQERFHRLMNMTGLSPFTSRLARRLSGGMKQKLGLACSLLRAPRFLILDEPTVGVDPLSRRELWSIINQLTREEHISVLLSTAYLDEAERCREVVMLYRGAVMGQGHPEEFMSRVQGRVFHVSVPGTKSRTIQETLYGRSNVRDAVVHGEGVRVIMDPGAEAEPDEVLPDMEKARIRSAGPRFEDGFVDLLREKSPAEKIGSHPEGLGRGADSAGGTVIRVRELTRRFGDFTAVKGISFDVERGEVFGLLGANGAGKTTTFRMLCGLLPLTSGSVRVVGVDLRRAAAAARARIGYMSQKFSLYGNLSVAQNLRFFSGAYGLSGNRQDQRISWAMEQFQLSPVADTISVALSLGFQQRLALACALMHEPDVLFLDEPTSGVDPLARRRFWRWINLLARQQVTVLVTTHFMEEAEYCDRLAIMDSGEILALGSPSEIKNQQRRETEALPSIEDAFIGLLQKSRPGGPP